jgi:hypothetical protein
LVRVFGRRSDALPLQGTVVLEKKKKKGGVRYFFNSTIQGRAKERNTRIETEEETYDLAYRVFMDKWAR